MQNLNTIKNKAILSIQKLFNKKNKQVKSKINKEEINKNNKKQIKRNSHGFPFYEKR